METLNSAINTVTTSVGSALGYNSANETAGVEPVNGLQGKGTATEPYDKGNETTATSVTNSSTTDNTTDSPAADLTTDKASTNYPAPTETTSPSTMSDNPTSAPNVPGPGPTPDADPKSAQAPETEHEGAKRPLEEPDKAEEKAIQDDKQTAEKEQSNGDSSNTTSNGNSNGLEKKPSNEEEREEMASKGELPKDPNDHSGEPMKMHGGSGDGSTDDAAADGSSGEKKHKVTEAERRASIGQEGGGEHGREQGTGEEWVKSSGLQADGGDFDASNPGAGREATRLLEEKGIVKDENTGGHVAAEGGPVKDVGGHDSGEKKQGTLSKLKEKLHIGSGKNTE